MTQPWLILGVDALGLSGPMSLPLLEIGWSEVDWFSGQVGLLTSEAGYRP